MIGVSSFSAITRVYLFVASIALMLLSSNALALKNFDHFETGFPLTGMHTNVECEACHLKGIFKGTPKQCQGCHNSQIAPGKSANHISSTNQCDNCHNEFNWDNAVLDHGAVMGGCNHCHDGVTATGKTAQHVPTAPVQCDGCHGTLAWSPARFDHDLAIGTCGSCHNGIISTGKPKDHVVTTQDCDACHRVRAWLPATGFNHENAAGRCNSAGCHSLPTPHISINGQCDHCHTTAGWKPVNKVDHDFVVGTCRSCHATLPSGHVLLSPSNPDCDGCHKSTLNWLDRVMVDHNLLDFKGQPCGNCHAADFVPGPHVKIEDPLQLYTATELLSCDAECHVWNVIGGTQQTIPPVHDKSLDTVPPRWKP